MDCNEEQQTPNETTENISEKKILYTFSNDKRLCNDVLVYNMHVIASKQKMECLVLTDFNPLSPSPQRNFASSFLFDWFKFIPFGCFSLCKLIHSSWVQHNGTAWNLLWRCFISGWIFFIGVIENFRIREYCFGNDFTSVLFNSRDYVISLSHYLALYFFWVNLTFLLDFKTSFQVWETVFLFINSFQHSE